MLYASRCSSFTFLVFSVQSIHAAVWESRAGFRLFLSLRNKNNLERKVNEIFKLRLDISASFPSRRRKPRCLESSDNGACIRVMTVSCVSTQGCIIERRLGCVRHDPITCVANKYLHPITVWFSQHTSWAQRTVWLPDLRPYSRRAKTEKTDWSDHPVSSAKGECEDFIFEWSCCLKT